MVHLQDRKISNLLEGIHHLLITVLNGSPRGKKSMTRYLVELMERFAMIDFQYIDVAVTFFEAGHKLKT